MKNLLRLFDFNQYSFSKKVILSLLAFIVIFMLLKVSLSIPIAKKRALDNEINSITKSLLSIKEKMLIIGKSLRMQSILEKELYQERIENEIQKIVLSNLNTKNQILEDIHSSKILKLCSYKLLDINRNVNGWNSIQSNEKDRSYKIRNYLQYHYNLRVINKTLSLRCDPRKLNPNHNSFEKELKEHMHTEMLVDSSLSSSKTAFFWLNTNIKIDDTTLYEEDKNKSREKYILSKLSNVDKLPTGKLTLKEIYNAKNSKSPVLHKIDSKEVYTWILDFSNDMPGSDRVFMIAHSVNKKELEDKSNSNVLFLFPETFIAMIVSFIVILLVFKRVLKNINTITKTAVLVNQGNKKIRSHIKGEDDIGVLGQSFDKMLDFFENSIDSLDKKVYEKTRELSESLEEKETLLKEIHHRVKNNLALTIGLLELQEEEIDDKRTKKVLIDIQERIYTMELLHRKLYESTNLNQISLKNYIVDLVNSISKAYNIDENISIDFKIEEINLNIEATMPLGLILNELVTNSFKYAFTENKNPKLYIEIKKNESEIRIVVKDNGKGIKEDILNPNTLGLKLINTIVKFQLQGKLSYTYEEGAKLIVEGKIKEDNSSKLI